MNILIVDDDRIIHIVLEKIIQKYDVEQKINIFHLNNGVGVEQMIVDKKIDLCFIDIVMDDREGIETIFNIKNEMNDIKVIAMSSEKDYLDIAADIGANHTMLKPIDANTVISLINKYKV